MPKCCGVEQEQRRHILVFKFDFPSSFGILFFQNTLTYFSMLRSQRITTIIGYYQIWKMCVHKVLILITSALLFIQSLGLCVLWSRPHEWEYIMYMRNLFLLPFFVVERDDKFVKMGWGGVSVFLLCLVSIIEKGKNW